MSKANCSYSLLATLLTFLFCYPLLGDTFEFTTVGTINPSSKSLIGSQVSGRVEKIFVDTGEEVRKGQPLVALDPVFFQIELDQKQHTVEASQIELADAEVNFLRMKRLWEKGEGQAPSVSLKKYEEANTRYERSKVQLKQDQAALYRAQVNLDETIIRAPFDGIITKKLVDAGETIALGVNSTVAEIQSITPVYLEFSVPQVYTHTIQSGTPLSFEIEGMGHSVNEARIDLIYPCLDEATRSVRCRANLPNIDKKIRPGSLAKVIIKGNKP